MSDYYGQGEFIKMLITFLEKISNIKMHSLQVGFITCILSRELNLNCEKGLFAGLFHDIGFLAPRYLRQISLMLSNKEIITLKKLLTIDALNYENSMTRHHSLIGSELMNFFPCYKLNEIILNHHKDAKVLNKDKESHFIANMIHLADFVSLEVLKEDGEINKNEILKRIEEKDDFFDELKNLFIKNFQNEFYWFMLTEEQALKDYILYSISNKEISLVELNIFTNIFTFLADHRSPFTRKHTESIEYTSGIIANELNLPDEIKLKLRISAKMHDVGKMAIPLRILEKPGKLYDSELWEMKRHIFYSYEILGGEFAYHKYDWIRWAVQHHERLDGSGYPCGKRVNEIELPARILQVSDVLVALLEDRPYRKGMELKEALSIIEKEVIDGKLDSDVFDVVNIMIKNGFHPIVEKGISEKIIEDLAEKFDIFEVDACFSE